MTILETILRRSWLFGYSGDFLSGRGLLVGDAVFDMLVVVLIAAGWEYRYFGNKRVAERRSDGPENGRRSNWEPDIRFFTVPNSLVT